MKSLLTVAIPTYNGGENLIRAIKSCKYINLPQDKFEILVVDNCSTDGSIEKVKLLQQDFPNIRIVINDKNYGRVGNWNRCIDLAKGKYLIFLFSNDEISKGYNFKKYINLLEDNNEIAIIFNKAKFVYDDIETISPSFYTKKIIELNLFVNEYFYKRKCFTSFGILQQHIYRLDVIKNNNIYFDLNIDRTTDRMFIFKTIFYHKKQLIYFSDEIQCIWNFSKNRYHALTHFKVEHNDLIKIFKKSWLQEIEANSYILIMSSFSFKEVLKIHYEYFYFLHVLNRIKKFLKYKYTNTPDNFSLIIFIKFLEGMCRNYKINCFKFKIMAFLNLFKKIFRKILKIIKGKINV